MLDKRRDSTATPTLRARACTAPVALTSRSVVNKSICFKAGLIRSLVRLIGMVSKSIANKDNNDSRMIVREGCCLLGNVIASNGEFGSVAQLNRSYFDPLAGNTYSLLCIFNCPFPSSSVLP